MPTPKRVSLATRSAQEGARAPAEPSAPPVAPVVSALWSEEPARQEVVWLDVQQIMPNRQQPRTIFDQAALEELAGSVHEHGVIQPIIVRPIPLTKWEGHARRYEIIAGERRWRASILAQQPTIPALIREDAGDQRALIELALIENLQRADLHPLEEARAFELMRSELGYSIRQIGERLSRSKGYVENRLKLLDLDDDLARLVSARPDTLMHVGELAKILDPAARAELIAAVRDGLSFAETQARVRALLAPPATPVPDEVSLRKDTHDRQPDRDYTESPASEVSLRKDTHDRQPDTDRGDSLTEEAAGELSLRKDTYDHQPGTDRGDWLTEEAAGELSLRKDTHDRQPGADHGDTSAGTPYQAAANARPTAAQPASLTLTTRERAALVELTEKLDQWLDEPARISAADWELLAPIAMRLSDLLRRLDATAHERSR